MFLSDLYLYNLIHVHPHHCAMFPTDQRYRNHVVQSFKPTPQSTSFQRPISDMNIASGCPQFAKQCILVDQRYARDDCMYIKCKVDTSTLFIPQTMFVHRFMFVCFVQAIVDCMFMFVVYNNIHFQLFNCIQLKIVSVHRSPIIIIQVNLNGTGVLHFCCNRLIIVLCSISCFHAYYIICMLHYIYTL